MKLDIHHFLHQHCNNSDKNHQSLGMNKDLTFFLNDFTHVKISLAFHSIRKCVLFNQNTFVIKII